MLINMWPAVIHMNTKVVWILQVSLLVRKIHPRVAWAPMYALCLHAVNVALHSRGRIRYAAPEYHFGRTSET